jgi:PKHD-type hydroxylase
MILSIDNFLHSDELDLIISHLNTQDFIDGKSTAGWHAKLVKDNTQLKKDVDYIDTLTELINKAFDRNTFFQIASQPKIIHSLLFSRYTQGMSYGRHTDNALMGIHQNKHRADISFTLFLNDPRDYEGGELIIELLQEEKHFKLNAGSLVFYPSSTLHRVETVRKGVRLVVVGWVESWVKDSHQREILLDIDTVRRSLFQKEGKSTEFDLLCKAHSNLLRQWSA